MVFDIFSKRAKRANQAAPDVYNYDAIPPNCRIQILWLWQRVIGDGRLYSRSNELYHKICGLLREEYGVTHLTGDRSEGWDELSGFFQTTKEIGHCLDVIELCMRGVINGYVDDHVETPEDIQRTLNFRLREAGVGYQFENNNIVRVDNQFIHAEVVKPALDFLSNKNFKGANEEFINAHKDYRAGNYKGCLVECLKAFESTMKTVCHLKGWTPEGDTASKLISTLFSHKLVPDYLQSQFTALKSVLESGTPTIRNKTAGHGQGVSQQNVPDYLAAYALHQTASAILFIMKAYES